MLPRSIVKMSLKISMFRGGKMTIKNEEDTSENEDNIDHSIQFKCHKCKQIVSLNDKFNDDLQKEQMCKLCTMTEAYV